MNKTFKGDFYKFLNKLKNKEHFSYSKYSDGELFILQGQEIILGPSPEHHSYKNSEDYKHFDPNKHAFFKEKLYNAFKFKHPNYYIGICALPDYTEEKFYWMKKQSGQDEEHLSWANLFVNSNYKLFRTEFVSELNNTKNIIICNEKSNVNLLPFKVEKDFRVGINCIINNLDLIEKISKYIIDEKIKNHVFLFACSSLGNVLIHELTKLEPENTYMDVGSTLNPLLGLSIDRGYLCAYEGQLWRGNDTSNDLNREETWKE